VRLRGKSLNDVRIPGRVFSTAFDALLVLQPQVIPYEEHILAQLQSKIIVIECKLFMAIIYSIVCSPLLTKQASYQYNNMKNS
jgi:hypothetical protein